MYVRNFGDGLSLPWQTVFQTTDKSAVELYCRRAGIEFEWKPGDRLRTRQVRPVVATHPRTGETVWFNHATFFHVTTLDPRMRDALTAEFGDEDLPNNTFYGDGSGIEPQVLDELRDAYQKEMISFSWKKGDLILLDNMLTAHARAPFVGPRKILFAMAEPFTRQDI
jgi:alpha-ketoglutarate-dependent taurine dioxygenase